MSTTTIIWTALPNGIDSKTGHYKLSVLASPRFTSTNAGDTVGGSAIGNWPNVVRNIPFGLWVNTPDVRATSVLFDPSWLANLDDGTMWNALFPAATPIAPYVVTSHKTKRVTSFAASKISRAIKAAYAHVAANHPRSFPVHDRTKTDPLNTLVRETEHALAALPHIARAHAQAPAGSTHASLDRAYRDAAPMGGEAGFELARHLHFFDHGGHRRNVRATAPVAGATLPIHIGPLPPIHPSFGPVVPYVDVHQVLGQLGDHPALLRKLGIIVDLVVTLPAGLPSPSAIVIDAGAWWTSAAPAVNVHPITQVTFLAEKTSAPAFRANPRDTSAIVEGQLPLSDPRYTIEELDTDGSAFKFVNHVQSTGSTGPNALPALRNGGLSVLRTDRADSLATAIGLNDALENAWFQGGSTSQQNSILLKAEDTLRGYRVDVRVVGGTWQSLCQRTSTIKLSSGAVTIDDEGYVKGTAATAPNGSTDEIDLHESIFGWDGWSLAVQRPGRPITFGQDPSTLRQTESGGDATNTKQTNVPVAIDVHAKAGTLPRLRFGTSYELRARLVDLAGNDLSVPGSEAGASGSAHYLRYEPVQSPALVLRAPLTEGESVEHVVIRSNPYGYHPQNAAQYAASQLKALDGTVVTPMNPYAATSERWVAPPKVSWSLAEQQGAFDATYFDPIAAARRNGDLTTFGTLKTALYDVSLKEQGTFLDDTVLDTSTGTRSPTQRVLRTNTAVAASQAWNRGDELPDGTYAVYPNALSSPPILPYLPDPNAAGMTLDFSAVAPTIGVAMRAWSPRAASWPELQVVPLQLAEGSTIAVTGTGASATGATPIVVSLPPGHRLDLPYGSTMVDASKMAQNVAVQTSGTSAAQAAVTSGQHWMMTPTRTITFVHAVQQPVAPSVAYVAGDRPVGTTAVPMVGTIKADGLTASHVDLDASWTEQVDVELGPGVTVGADGIRRIKRSGRVGTFSLATTDTAATLTSSTFHELGDTKHRRQISYMPIATSRFREYFPAALAADPANVQNSPLVPYTTPIKSSARPPMPRVLYVIPTFRNDAPVVTTSGAQTVTTKNRAGGGLRVYVDRPWFVSGDDEMLAALIPNAGSTAASLPDYVSQWAIDPTWYPQQETLSPLDANHFVPNATRWSPAPNLALAEGVGSVTAIGYLPQYNADRKVWYFDIELTPDAIESPMVRLVLARLQLGSLGGLELSQVVRTEMVRIAADRTAVYAVNSDHSVALSVTGRVFANETWSPPSQPIYEPPPPRGGGGLPMMKTQSFIVRPPPPSVDWAMASGHAVVAQFEESTAATPGDLDWLPLGPALRLKPTQAGGVYDDYSTQITFTGTLSFPSAVAQSGAKHRIVIKEYEIYATDDDVKDNNGFTVRQGSSDNVSSRSRVVYCDVLPVAF